jgi:predicted DNA-binding transcriptional regulator AlpA
VDVQYPSTKQVDPAALLRLKQVLDLIPVSKSTWWSGVRNGRFPKPVKLSRGITCWRARDILDLIERAAVGGGRNEHR